MFLTKKILEINSMWGYVMKCNVVIPMAGAGSRFSIAGYNVPKPFIEFDNKMMIEHVLNSFKKINANFN